MQRVIEQAGIPTILIAALPPIARQAGVPRACAPMVPIGANAGAPGDPEMQYHILRDTLSLLWDIQRPGEIVPLPYQYVSRV